MKFYANKFQLFTYAILIEAMIGLGDIALFLAFPEVFLYVLVASAIYIIYKRTNSKLYKLFTQKKILLNYMTIISSYSIFLNCFIWNNPYKKLG